MLKPASAALAVLEEYETDLLRSWFCSRTLTERRSRKTAKSCHAQSHWFIMAVQTLDDQSTFDCSKVG